MHLLLLGLFSLAPLHPQEEAAAALLFKAEDLGAKGQYAKAWALYKRLADKHPDTLAGKTAFARIQSTGFVASRVLVDNGPSRNRLDVVILGDGFTLEHQRAFDNLAEDVSKLFKRNDVLGEYYGYQNFTKVNLVSWDDGIDANGRKSRTALDGHQSRSLQGQVAVNPAKVHQRLADLPAQDGLAVVFVKSGSLGSSSAGVATIAGRSNKTLIHEWGHAFGGLGDEYASTTGHRSQVRSRINISSTGDPKRVPWKHWIEAKARGVGVYQGANGQVRGAWKPNASECIMEDDDRFCIVCREALVRAFYRFVDPIDERKPVPHFAERLDKPATRHIRISGTKTFEVRVMRPKSHEIAVRWWILPEKQRPRSPVLPPDAKDRSVRGKLPKIADKPYQTSPGRKSGLHKLKISKRDLSPGRYALVCRAIDTTKVAGEDLPWVISDPDGRLESEVVWLIEVK